MRLHYTSSLTVFRGARPPEPAREALTLEHHKKPHEKIPEHLRVSRKTGEKVDVKKVYKKDRIKTRPPSGYQLYIEACRGEIEAQNPGISYVEVKKILTENWYDFDPVEKREWLDKAKANIQIKFKIKFFSGTKTAIYRFFLPF